MRKITFFALMAITLFAFQGFSTSVTPSKEVNRISSMLKKAKKATNADPIGFAIRPCPPNQLCLAVQIPVYTQQQGAHLEEAGFIVYYSM